MTDHDVPAFDDPSYDALRGLLADARSTDPVPADVAARLDATLAGLTADRGTGSSTAGTTSADVVPLRRRSRLAPRLLVAAAAIVVVGASGVGLNHVLGPDGTTTLADTAPGTASLPAAPEAASPQTPSAQRAPGTAGKNDLDDLAAAALPQFTTAGFAADALQYSVQERRLRSTTSLKGLDAGPDQGTAAVPRPAAPNVNGPAAGGGSAYSADGGTTDTRGSVGGKSGTVQGNGSAPGSAATTSCEGPTGTDAEIVPIVLDGAPAALAVHPVKGGTQLIEAWSCDGRSVLVATSVAR